MNRELPLTMVKHHPIIVLLLLLTNCIFAQPADVETKQISITKNNYSSFAIINDRLFAISGNGRIVVWDLNKFDTLHFNHSQDTSIKYTAIAKDRNGALFAGTDQGNIFKIDPIKLSDTFHLRGKYRVYSIFFNSANKMYLVVHKAIYDLLAEKLWWKFRHSRNSNFSVRRRGMRTHRFFVMPEVTFLDEQDRLWMATSYGEFGCRMQIFDTRNEKKLRDKFSDLSTSDLYPQSFFSDGKGNIFVTSGLHHFSSFGSIYRLTSQRQAVKIFDSDDMLDTSKPGYFRDRMFVGPGTFCRKDSCIYFATDNGFYKASFLSPEKLDKPELLFNCSLNAEREPLAIGMMMSVKHMEFIADNKLLFLTTGNGFGLYDGSKVVLFK